MDKTTERVKEERCRKGVARFLSVIEFRDDNPKVSEIFFAKLAEIRRKESASNKTFLKITKTKDSRRDKSPDNPLSNTIFNGVDHSSEDQSVENTENEYSTNTPCLFEDLIISDGGVDLNDYIRSIGGSNLELMFEKRLTKTDVTKSQGRLLIPVKQVKNLGFLTKDEKNILMRNKEGINVRVLDSKRRTWTLNLGIWSMSSSENYVFKSGWNHVVNANGLKENMMVRVWSFRVDKQMCFALVRV
ncbi:B3 domain-containing protein, DNA-binding pseudobarrel domain protein [Artemisia annua]|uniref:B3 domain-containing protein, DNA-binding pseudobarrel domain protein n=1 Tax=Artemisia annua TaxID=35608 RepID=A0A2U1P4T9_ARTAN|nr:B3 domain-containing protein, DNA-binding pseudobarrel domain protein [Artemisia annua]